MSRAEAGPRHSKATIVERGVRRAIEWIGWAACSVASPVLRIALAVPFLRSGLTKWDGFLSISPGAVYLFEEEFKLHILGGTYEFPAPWAAAVLTGTAEVVLPVLLVAGFATRFAAFGVLIMTVVIQLVLPEAWANFHLPWAAMAIAIIALGPGPLSLDYVVEKYFRSSARITSG